jgi:hypothetical protein
MSANQPTTFRFPFNIDDAKDTHPTVKAAIRYAFSGLLDAQNAIKSLNNKVNGHTAGIQTVTKTVAEIQSGASIPTPAASTIGLVNLQPNSAQGNTAYTLNQSDYGGLILVNSTPAFPITLNTGLNAPFFTTIYNFGAGAVVCTPDVVASLVNNGASVTLNSGHFGTFYFDPNRNFWAIIT